MNNSSKTPFFIICGPTGSGKTDLSYAMAKRFPFEIVNCDVGQCYEPLTIGTAKPDWQNHAVQHNLFDCLAEPRNMSVTEYRGRLLETMSLIRSRKKIPLLVGGSLFYVRSLFFPPLDQGEIKDSEERVFLPDFLQEAPTEELWNKLNSIDSERALSIKKEDRYRLQRALELWQATGIVPSAHKPVFQPFEPFCLTFVTRDRKELYARINQRVRLMFEQGWVTEVAQLSEEWKQFLMQKKLVGYNDILACLQSNNVSVCARDQKLIDTIAQKTRNYAKRQETFWRSFKPDLEEALRVNYGERADLFGTVQELNLTLSPVDVYLDHIAHQLV